MVYMMEKYADNLEEVVYERTEQLIEEKKKTEALLDRMLPRSDEFIWNMDVLCFCPVTEAACVFTQFDFWFMLCRND